MRYDVIIANPPYGKIGNEITKAVVDNIDYGVFVNLLPANDYRRFHKEDKLYQFVDINSMRPVNGAFEDAAVTTMMCRVNKDRALYVSEAEFEIENYTDKSLKKYFYENRNRVHYAIDAMPGAGQTLKNAGIWDCSKTFIMGYRDMNHKHMPYGKNCTTYKWNVEESIDMQYLIDNHNTRDGRFMISQCVFNTEKEKKNFVNFIYSPDGFRFISKLFTAVNCDGTIRPHVFPKVDWTRPQTVESILKDYGYTPSEIEEVVADLANFKGMNENNVIPV